MLNALKSNVHRDVKFLTLEDDEGDKVNHYQKTLSLIPILRINYLAGVTKSLC